MLHPQNSVPATLMPNEKSATTSSVPINSNFSATPTSVQVPVRNEFPPQMVPPVMQTHSNNQSGVFVGKLINFN